MVFPCVVSHLGLCGEHREVRSGTVWPAAGGPCVSGVTAVEEGQWLRVLVSLAHQLTVRGTC